MEKLLKFYKYQDKIVLWSMFFSIMFALFIFIAWASNYRFLPPQLPLYYSLPWGDGQLVDKSQFIILPSIIILIMLVNLIISWHLHPSQLAIKRILMISTSVIGLVILMSVLKILFIFV